MSYTNKKVVWEKCKDYNISIEEWESLTDARGKILEDYLNDILRVSKPEVNEYGDTIMDEYGDIKRPEVVIVLARKQPHEEVLRTPNGKELLTKSYFYVDPRIEPNALKIKHMDKLDGETIINRYVMCDLHNRPKMIRFITI